MAKEKAKVVKIGTGQPVEPQSNVVDPLVVRRLEEMLERARSGDLVGIAWVYEHGTVEISWGVTGRYNGSRMAGGISAIHYAVTKRLYEETT